MLFGDYWLERSVPLPSSALVSLLADFGVSEVAARAALSRMVKKHLLVSSRSGRNTAYLVTPRTVGVLRAGLQRMGEFGHAERPWDRIWSVVVFTAPERNRALRDAIRSRLRWLGFAPLADGVWVSPRGRHETAVEELTALGLTGVTSLTATVPFAGAGDRSPEEAWDLDSLSHAYRQFIDDAERLSAAVAAGSLGPTEALVQRTRLADDWIELANSDPDLPRELLPEDWPRGEARAAFVAAHSALGERAIERVAAAIEAAAPSISHLVVHRAFVV